MKKAELKYSIIKKSLLFILFLIITSHAFSQLPPPPAPEITAEVLLDTASEGGKTAVIRIFYSFPENFHQTLNRDFFKAEVIYPEGFSAIETEYPEGIEEKGEINYYGSAELVLTGDVSSLAAGEYNVKIKASYQLCDDVGTCYLPGSKELEAKFEIPLSDSSHNGINTENNGITGILKYLFLAFIGGLLLNIMPCVFPLLSIKALSLVKQSEDNKREILLSSLFYSAGIIISLMILAVFLIIIKNAGQFAGWGFQMQNKWFVLFLGTVIYLFALSMFDVFTITLPGINTAGKLSARKGYSGHFLTGIFAVLVAAPCTAPFLGSAIAFSLSGSSLIIFLSFFFIGAGFSFPFILLGFNPELVKKLPKPGKWSVYFKEILGFILAGTALYLLLSFSKGKPASVLSSIVIFLFTVTFLAWIYGKTALSGLKRKYSVLLLLLLLSLAAAAAKIIPDFEYNEKQISSAVETFSESSISRLLDEGNSVFVDIYADWCTTCKINDRLVINTEEIQNLFKENRIVLLKGDFTNGDPEIASWMKKNGKAGVPVYAFFRNSETPAVFLPELLTKKKIIDLLSLE